MYTHTKTTAIVQTAALLFALLSPAYAFATPAGVTGIQAQVVGNEVRVRWTAVTEGGPVSAYRVYYNSESILENDGEYDDFEETAGPVTEHTLTGFVPSEKLYVSVLAVDAAGVESDFFLEETMVTLDQSTEVTEEEPTDEEEVEEEASSSAPGQQIPRPTLPGSNTDSSAAASLAPASETFAVVSAEANSATGVLITFSLPVLISPEQAATAFTIKNSSGTQLVLTRLLIAGNRVQIHTEVQTKNVPYIIEASSVIQGKSTDPAKAPVALSAVQNKALFLGHAAGKEGPASAGATSSESQSSVAGQPRDIMDLNIRATPASNKRYDVVVTWRDPNPAGTVRSFEVRQSPDNGKTFTAPQQIPGNTQMVSLKGVPAGEFGIAVRAVSATGTASNSIFASIALAQLSTPDDLSNSGLGMGALLVTSGAIAGWKRMRRKSL